MKFIDKLFSSADAPWKSWVLSDTTTNDTLWTGGNSFIWKIVNDELTTYRSLTAVQLHNGASTSFWFDHWLPNGPLFASHAALFSHTLRPNISVQRVFQTNFDLCLRPRLTNAASAQLAALLSCLQEIHLDDLQDQRLMKLTGKRYTARDAYYALKNSSGDIDLHGQRKRGH
jgi:hypothetical protein